MLREVVLGVVLFGTAVVSPAAEYVFDGRLEPGDQQDAESPTFGSYFDAYPFEALKGDNIRFEISGMTMMPHVIIYDANLAIIYATHSVASTSMTVDWEAPETGAYTFVVTQSYREDTPYHLVISDQPPGTAR